MLDDFLPYNRDGSYTVATAPFAEVNDNVIYATVVGAAPTQSVLIRVDAMYAYVVNRKCALMQSMRSSSDPRLPQQVLYNLERSDLKFVRVLASSGSGEPRILK